ncbi:MAG: hypothetical protein RQ728_00760 [Brevefilum sp.]|nr:hypothetical protein [Brevefilum sp.]MDT8380769.1 hypothetical protein [Brevefilum sp.]MDW7753644.1 hypothetical protein [Brevefilum sp.]
MPILTNANGPTMDDQYDKDNSEKANTDFDSSQDEEHNDEFSEMDDLPSEDETSESELNNSGQWVKEILENTDEDDNAVLQDLQNLPVKQGDLPDWINTLSQSGGDEQISDEHIEEEQEKSDAIHFKSLDDSWDTEEPIEENIQNEETEAVNEIVQPDEGFVEISQFDLEASDNLEKSEDEVNQQNEEQEELPDWLEEMIEEPETEKSEKMEFEDEAFNPDEATKPVIVTSIEAEDEMVIDEQPIEAAPLTTDLPVEEYEKQFTEDEVFIDDQVAEDLSIAEEEIPPDKAPFEGEMLIEQLPSLEIENVEKFDSDEGDWHEEILLSSELPKSLKFAKYLLDQGEIEPSFEIFQTYVRKSEHLEEIKTWAKEAAAADKEKSNLLWELIGDLSLKQNKPDEALSAYTLAISKLIRK